MEFSGRRARNFPLCSRAPPGRDPPLASQSLRKILVVEKPLRSVRIMRAKFQIAPVAL